MREPSVRVASIRVMTAVWLDEMILSHDIGERRRTQLVGKRPRGVAREVREQPSRFALAAGAHPPNTAVICWPPRRMVNRHSRFGWETARTSSCVVSILALLIVSTTSPF